MELLSSKKSKAQLISSEFFIALVVITLLFSVSVVFWNQSTFRIKESEERTNIEIATLAISDHLLKSSGLPSDWEDNTSTTFSLGLVKDDHRLDTNKLKSFVKLDYNTTKKMLGIDSYEFYFRLVDQNNSLLKIDGTNLETGIMPSNASIAMNAKRIALLDQPVFMDVILWR